jgi:hypothetical protein
MAAGGRSLGAIGANGFYEERLRPQKRTPSKIRTWGFGKFVASKIRTVSILDIEPLAATAIPVWTSGAKPAA